MPASAIVQSRTRNSAPSSRDNFCRSVGMDSWSEIQLKKMQVGGNANFIAFLQVRFSALEEGSSRFAGIVMQSSFRNDVAAPHCCLTNSFRMCYLFRNMASLKKLVNCSNTVLLQRKSIRTRFKLSPKAVHGSIKQIRRTAR